MSADIDVMEERDVEELDAECEVKVGEEQREGQMYSTHDR